MISAFSTSKSIESWLGNEAESLLNYEAKLSQKMLHLPGEDFVDRIFHISDRNPHVLRSLQRLYSSGKLANTAYLSILPVDQAIELSAAAAFAPNPIYFDPENSVRLALDGGCNAIATTLGFLAMASRKYAHRIPFVVKLNHNELLSYPNNYDQVMFSNVKQAYELGAVAIGATIYFGSRESSRQIQEVSKAFSYAHKLGMATILWCYLRNEIFQQNVDYHFSADLTGQANHLGSTIKADIVKQRLPECNHGYTSISEIVKEEYGRTNEVVYSKLTTEHPIDLTRYQVLNCYSGKIGLISSGGPSGKNDFAEAIRTAVINKRAGGFGLIAGRKAFQRPLKDGIQLLNAIQDVYLSSEVTIA